VPDRTGQVPVVSSDFEPRAVDRRFQRSAHGSVIIDDQHKWLGLRHDHP
jgi:hypothetical protein